MLWVQFFIRCLSWWIFIVVFVLFALLYGCMHVLSSRMSVNKNLAKKIPELKKILTKKAHKPTEEDLKKNPDNNECVICFDDFMEDGKEIVELDCNNKHVFHLECLEKWIEKNNNCPMCREEINVNEEKKDEK